MSRKTLSVRSIGHPPHIPSFFGWCALLFTLSGCNITSIHDYKNKAPNFDPENFFNGKLIASGIVKNFTGKVIRHFNAEIAACWSEGIGILDEKFVFNDGEMQTRTWELTPLGSQRYLARANDVVGEAIAEWQGQGFFLKYTLAVKLENTTINFNIDDRMYRINDDLVINESKMRKFGLPIGEILLTLRRMPSESKAACATS